MSGLPDGFTVVQDRPKPAAAPATPTPAPGKPPESPGLSRNAPAGFTIQPPSAAPAPHAAPPAPPAHAPTPAPSHAPGPVDVARNAAGTAYDVANRFWTEAWSRYKASAANPLGAAANLEQTPARGLSHLIMHGLSPQSFAGAFHDALNPGEGDADAQRIVDLIKAKMPKTTNPIGDFAETFVAQSIADPVSYIPVVAWLAKTATAARTLDLVATAARSAGGAKAAKPVDAAVAALKKTHEAQLTDVLDHLTPRIMRGRPELNDHLASHAKTARIGIEHREIGDIERELGGSDRELLAQHEKVLKDLKGGTLPEEIRQRYLQEPWRYGTPQMRAEAEKMGYHPVASDARWEKAPEGLLDYNLREDYQYLGKVSSDLRDGPMFRKYRPRTGDKAAFEYEREGDWKPGTDQYNRTRARLSMGRNAVWQRRADNATKDYLETHGGWKGDGAIDVSKLSTGPTQYDIRIGQMVPPVVKDLIDKTPLKNVRALDRIGEWPLRTLGQWGTQSVMGTVLPHALNNVGTLSYVGAASKIPGVGGLIALGRAAGYNIAAIAKPELIQSERIKNLGALAEYTTDPGTIWSKIPGLGSVLRGGQKALSHMELSYRQGLLDELDRTMGKSFDRETGQVTDQRLEFEKGQKIRDAVVDYRNVPVVVAWLQAMGAPFAPFFGGLTYALTRAVLQHPERVAAVQRMAADVQDQFGWTIPNPVSTFAHLAFDPIHEVLQRAGPIGGAILGATMDRDRISSAAQDLGWAVERYGGPWLSQLPGFFNLPFPEKGSEAGDFTPGEGFLHMLFGIYPYSGPAGQYDIRQIQKSESRAQ